MMLKTLSITFAVFALLLLVAYVFLVANQIRKGCPKRVKQAWASLGAAAIWMIGALAVDGWADCLGWALCALVCALLSVLVVERRGFKHLPWKKVRL
jgi:predicted lysophospholipase L1 biosynthesis ABC-type transport system permease subunit